MELVTEQAEYIHYWKLKYGCSLLENQYSRGVDGKVALFQRPATERESGFMFEGQFPQC